MADFPNEPEELFSPRRSYAAAWIGRQATKHAEHALLFFAADNSTDIFVEQGEWSTGIIPADLFKAVKNMSNIRQKSELLLDTLQPEIFRTPGDTLHLLKKLLPEKDFKQPAPPNNSSKPTPILTLLNKYGIIRR